MILRLFPLKHRQQPRSALSMGSPWVRGSTLRDQGAHPEGPRNDLCNKRGGNPTKLKLPPCPEGQGHHQGKAQSDRKSSDPL